MHPQAIVEKLTNVEVLSKALRSAPRPNNSTVTFDFEAAYLATEAVSQLRNLHPIELVPTAEIIQRSITFPTFDYVSADRDLLLYKIRCQELHGAIGELINQSIVYEGYQDPTIETKQYRNEIARIDLETRQLQQNISSILDIVASLRDDRSQSGIALSLGPISADLKAIESISNSMLGEIRERLQISSALLLYQMRQTRNKAASLVRNLRSSINYIGATAYELAVSIFKKATHILREGLDIVRDILSRKIRNNQDGYTLQSEKVASILQAAWARNQLADDAINFSDDYFISMAEQDGRYFLTATPKIQYNDEIRIELEESAFAYLAGIPKLRMNDFFHDYIFEKAVKFEYLEYDKISSESVFGNFFRSKK